MLRLALYQFSAPNSMCLLCFVCVDWLNVYSRHVYAKHKGPVSCGLAGACTATKLAASAAVVTPDSGVARLWLVPDAAAIVVVVVRTSENLSA